MNYRHAFHAGNFADVVKHAILARVLSYLIQKPAPLRYIDTHAGIGWYDLADTAAARTGEWRDGIGRLDAEQASPAVQALLAPYLDAVGPRDVNGRPLAYPGSPAVAQQILRAADRLLLSERHPEDAALLLAAVKRDKRVKVIAGDGYRSLNAALPPPERRGLVLIDPPFEDRAEFDLLADALATAHRKWQTGVYMLWYPVKDTAQIARFQRTVQALALPKWLSLTMERDVPQSGSDRLRGCGLVVVNPPYRLKADADLLLPFLAACFARADTGPWRWQVNGHGV